ncbi:ROK family protein [Actinoplanes sp. NPDC049596]|uniref:ROK family transcriptional regulator n=1 Tax=unclassified Actinoplanes TaxID=2626549 RepID=UPI00341F7DF6
MEISDEQVLRTLMRHRRLTRAELATEIGISKPTAGESVRRLTERGLVADTGERTAGGRGKGRVGSYYALSPGAGAALAVTIAPEGVVAECVDVYGDTVGRAFRPAHPTEPSHAAGPAHPIEPSYAGRPTNPTEPSRASGPAQPAKLAAAVASAVEEATRLSGARPIRLAVVGAADPVDRATGRLVHLPDAPFLVGELDPVAILAPYVSGPVTVDNDVNWAALAERDHRAQPSEGSRPNGHEQPSEHARSSDERDRAGDFAYLYLGEGLGCAIVSDGEVRRGHSGLAGELAHLLTVGPGGRAVRFIEVFGRLGLRRDSSTAIDVDRLLASDAAARAMVARAVGGVVAAVTALADPREIVLGGSWGPALADDIRAAGEQMPRHVPIRAAAVSAEPVLAGVRAEAVSRLRASLIATG